MSYKRKTGESRGKYHNKSFGLINSSNINTLTLPLLIFPTLHLVINEDIKRRNCCERSKDTPEDNQESTHDGFSFRMVGE